MNSQVASSRQETVREASLVETGGVPPLEQHLHEIKVVAYVNLLLTAVVAAVAVGLFARWWGF